MPSVLLPLPILYSTLSLSIIYPFTLPVPHTPPSSDKGMRARDVLVCVCGRWAVGNLTGGARRASARRSHRRRTGSAASAAAAAASRRGCWYCWHCSGTSQCERGGRRYAAGHRGLHAPPTRVFTWHSSGSPICRCLAQRRPDRRWFCAPPAHPSPYASRTAACRARPWRACSRRSATTAAGRAAGGKKRRWAPAGCRLLLLAAGPRRARACCSGSLLSRRSWARGRS